MGEGVSAAAALAEVGDKSLSTRFVKAKTFIQQLDDQKVLSAISEAERKTSGEIRIYISNENIDDVFAAAQKQFVRLAMHHTQQRNGVLLYFAPRVQRFAIVGDKGIHEKCGDSYWHEITTQMIPLLKQGQFTQAAVEAIRRMGAVLAEHFPRAPDDRNELPDSIVRD